MSKGAKILLISAGILLIFVIIVYTGVKRTYNSFVTLDEGVNAAWAQVENQFQRRYDLIPNLVETVKGYASHEREVLTQVTQARASVGGAGTVDEKIKANNELSSALSRLLVVVENYPNLKADQSFIRLQDELAGTENRIAVAQRRYNETVRDYNQTVRSFPTNIFASIFNFERADLFETVEEAKKAPEVKF